MTEDRKGILKHEAENALIKFKINTTTNNKMLLNENDTSLKKMNKKKVNEKALFYFIFF